MSFVNKFKSTTQNTTEIPPGVNYAHTSFGYQKNQQSYSGLAPPPKNSIQQKPRPRGGWDDDEDDEKPQLRGTAQSPYNKGNETQARPNEFKQTSEFKEAPNRSIKEFAILQSDQSFIANHEYEYKLIHNLIQPGGARLKQTEQLLNNFCQACESLQVPVVGSLILNQFHDDLPFVSKARLLYLLEALVRKLNKYSDYLRHNIDSFQSIDFSQEGSNATQLVKIREDIVNFVNGTENAKKNSISYSKPSESMKENHIVANEDLLGLTQPNTQGGPSTNLQNQNSQQKKVDPFNLNTSNSNQQQNVTKPSGPSFAKFKAQVSQDKTQQVPQPQSSNKSNNLIDALSGLDFGPVQPHPDQASAKPQNGNNIHHISQKTFNPVPGGFASQHSHSNGGAGYYGGNANMGGGFNKQTYGNGGFMPQNNYQGSGFGLSGGAMPFKQSAVGAYTQNIQFEKASANGNRFDELYNLVHQDFNLEEEDNKKKVKAQNEKAFDALKF